MIFESKTVIYITNRGLEFISNNKGFDFTFAPDEVSNQEIINKDKLALRLGETVKETDFKVQDAVIVMADNLVYERSIEVENEKQAEEELQTFLAKIPFDESAIATIRFMDQKNLNVIATNSELYKGITEIMEKTGWRILAVVPAPAFGIINKTKISPKEAKLIMNKLNTESKFNFLTKGVEAESSDKLENKEDDGSSRTSLKILIICVILAIILIAGIIFIYFRFYVKTPIPEPIQPNPNITAGQENLSATPASQPAKITPDRSGIKLEVLNGTGLAGQAARIKTQLENLGYSDISVDNYSGIYRQGTMVNYKVSLPENFRQEIIAELNKTNASVSAEATSSGLYDLVIIIGK